MSDERLPDPLEQFLAHPPSAPVTPELRARLLRETSASLHRPRRWRRWAAAGGVAAALALAVSSAYWVRYHRIEVIELAPLPKVVERRQELPPKESPPVTAVAPVVAAVPERPLDAEWRAFDTDDDQQRARLYFRAGDLYLEQAQDVASALRCYQQALQYCAASDLETDVNDSWLVMALKRDRRKEQ